MEFSKPRSLESASVGAKILRSSWWLGMQVVIDIGLAFAFAAIAVRRLGPASFGLVTLVQAFLNVVGQGTLSFELAIIRLVPEFRGQHAWATAQHVIKLILAVKMTLASGLAIGLFTVAPFLAIFYHEPELLWAVRLGCLSLIAAAASEVGAATCIALLHAETLTLVTTVRRLCELTGVLIVTALGKGVPAVVLVLGVADLIAAACYGLAIVYYWHQDPRSVNSPAISGTLMPRILRYCLPIAGARFLDVLGREAGKFLLGRFARPEVLGYYGIARLMTERSMALLGQVTNAVLPAITQMNSNGVTWSLHQRVSIWNELVRRGFRYQWFISSSLVLVMWAIAPFALLLVGGPTYASAVLATRILAIMVFLWSGTALANTIFFAHENTLGILGINAIQLVSVVMLYRLWVADWQLMGAVFADTVGQGLALVFCLWLAGRWFGFASKEVGRLFILSGLWVVAIVLPIGLTNYEGAGLFLWLGAGLGLLGSLLFLGGLPTPTDWHMMATIIQTPAWLTRFVQPVLYLLRRYQSFLRVTFKRHKRFKSRK